jgi:hypothetical protein
MPRSRRWSDLASDDEGTASLEFITAGLVLLLPIVYLVLTMSAVQGGALAVEGASRQAARVFVEAPTLEQAQSRALLAVQYALADYGIDPAAVTVSVTCTPTPTDCLERRGLVTVAVETAVALPLAPAVLEVDAPFSVPLAATSTQQVSRFGGAR